MKATRRGPGRFEVDWGRVHVSLEDVRAAIAKKAEHGDFSSALALLKFPPAPGGPIEVLPWQPTGRWVIDDLYAEVQR